MTEPFDVHAFLEEHYWRRYKRTRPDLSGDRDAVRQLARTIVHDAGVMRMPAEDEPPLTKEWADPPAPQYVPTVVVSGG